MRDRAFVKTKCSYKFSAQTLSFGVFYHLKIIWGYGELVKSVRCLQLKNKAPSSTPAPMYSCLWLPHASNLNAEETETGGSLVLPGQSSLLSNPQFRTSDPYTYAHTCTPHMCACTCNYTFIRIYTHTCAQTCLHTCIHICIIVFEFPASVSRTDHLTGRTACQVRSSSLGQTT